MSTPRPAAVRLLLVAAFAALSVLQGAACAIPSAEAAPAVFSGEEMSVQGEFLKPEIVVVMSRENLNKAYDLTLDEDFLARIVKSVEAEPF
jgi:hypothetical protein